MKGVESAIEPLLADLKSDEHLPHGAEEAMRRAIAESPYLNHLLANAAKDGHVARIAVSHGHHNGGHFQDATENSPPTIFISASNFKSFEHTDLAERLTEVLGHETMHGILAAERRKSLEEFKQAYSDELEAAHASRSGTVNLTEPVRKFLDKGRQDEALSEVSGLRALDSRLRHLNPTLGDKELEFLLAERSRSRCVRTDGEDRVLDENVSYDAVAKRPNNQGPQLTKAVEQCFYDGKARWAGTAILTTVTTTEPTLYPLSEQGTRCWPKVERHRPSGLIYMNSAWTRSSWSAMASTLAMPKSWL